MTYLTNKSTHKKIDGLLQKIQSFQSQLGIDSTKHERKQIEAKQLMLWYKIKSLDEQFFKDAYLVD